MRILGSASVLALIYIYILPLTFTGKDIFSQTGGGNTIPGMMVFRRRVRISYLASYLTSPYCHRSFNNNNTSSTYHRPML